MPPRQPRQRQHPAPQLIRRLDPKIWRACAGASVQIPVLHSRVYYFPQGHLEQASSTPQYLSSRVLSCLFVHCRISAVEFLAHPDTDEVFVKLLLQPIGEVRPQDIGDSVESPDDDKVVSFVKVLTPSDANNGGGFSVPRFCADSILPPLNYQSDQPAQTLSITDVHGVSWEFRHVYRGTPKRHLLTTGWSKFVDKKKLIAGDSVVFMKDSRGELFVGIRRAVRFTAGNVGDCARWCSPGTKVEEEMQKENCASLSGGEGFSRAGRGKLSAKSVAEAAELAAQNMPFEVVYFPRAGWSDFVVKAEVVEEAVNIVWAPGMRVKMAMETDDASRMTWFQGTISSACAPDNGLWRGSPWRMLQVTWDEPEVLQNAKRVSPWQVEHVCPTPTLHTPFPPTKKFRASDGSGVPVDREGDHIFPMTEFTNSAMAYLNQPLLNYNTFPAGMQGARHDLSSVSSFRNFLSDNTHSCNGNSFGNYTVPKLKTLPTELIGSSQSDLSLDSQSSLHSISTEFVGIQSGNSTKPFAGSFKLFGKIIQTEQPVESSLQSAGCTGGSGCKCCKAKAVENPLVITQDCSTGFLSS
ncbi:hypothetical protein L6164_016130 [Bauhinia variegata]|uniref:Uncharacterized protein n=1 Tax=Bauhinia variegata TaxID=167791 RepID=A0ACB9NMF9_BAUVA|nr:hypothetical protein L6164_016130 [Bauhinia variegata]